jgi:hypothetical protein
MLLIINSLPPLSALPAALSQELAQSVCDFQIAPTIIQSASTTKSRPPSR